MTIEKAVDWRTGRYYDGKEQRVFARLLDDEAILFCDVTRGTWGEFYGKPDATWADVRTEVMMSLDGGWYRTTTRAGAFAAEVAAAVRGG